MEAPRHTHHTHSLSGASFAKSFSKLLEELCLGALSKRRELERKRVPQRKKESFSYWHALVNALVNALIEFCVRSVYGRGASADALLQLCCSCCRELPLDKALFIFYFSEGFR
jgi:hypothetical protein